MIKKKNQTTALRFQTGDGHQTHPSSISSDGSVMKCLITIERKARLQAKMQDADNETVAKLPEYWTTASDGRAFLPTGDGRENRLLIQRLTVTLCGTGY